MENNKKEYKILRTINWIIALLIFSGSIIMSLKATAIGLLIILLLGGFIFLNYAGTAMALSQEGYNFIFGFPIIVKKSFLVISNIILILMGLAIIIFSFTTSQYLISISGFIYLIPSLLNIIALKSQV